jgi:hypothetical protein
MRTRLVLLLILCIELTSFGCAAIDDPNVSTQAETSSISESPDTACTDSCTNAHATCKDWCDNFYASSPLQDCYDACQSAAAECVDCCNKGESNCAQLPPGEYRDNDFISSLTLTYGEYIVSSSRKAKLIFQWDGNLVVYDENNRARWASNTVGRGHFASFQQDGNFVVYQIGRDGSKTAAWASNTCCYWGGHLAVQDDGNVVIYKNTNVNVGSAARWSTRTNH